MGAYLSQPVTSKERFEGAGKDLQYGGGAMQGWRRTMEDAHIAEIGLAGDESCAMFGVFDGHGGAEVAKFCQKYMATEIQQLAQFTAGDDVVEEALVEVFHRMDDMLRHPEYADEIEAMRVRDKDEEDETGEDPGQPMDALEMLKRVFQLKRFMGENGQPGEAASSNGPEAMEEDAQPAEGEAPKDQEAAAAAAAAGNGGASSEAAAAGAGGEAAGTGSSSSNSSREGGGRAAAAAAVAAPPPARPANTVSHIAPDIRIQAGCTAVVAVKKANWLYVANAGDSRGVLCRGSQAVALSEDHKPAQETERTRILNAGGFLSEIGGVCRVNGNLNLSRAIGDLKYKNNSGLPPKDQIITAQPDVCKIELLPGDSFFLLACDGVWDVMTNQEAVDFVRTKLEAGLAPSEAACALLDECLADDPKEARGVGCDNMTAVVVKLNMGDAPAQQ